MNKEAKPHYHGHRERMRQKLLNNGADALADYELLEMVLMCAIPRRDVKPLAKDLMKKFGGFSDVLNASHEELLEIKGIKENTIAFFEIIKQSAILMTKRQAFKNPVINSWDKLIDYCVIKMGYGKVESFRVIFLDTKLRLISDEKFSEGTVDQTSLFPREILKTAVKLGATSIIMVHNHPSGDTKPSKADISMTKKVIEALKPVNIDLVDHLVISKNSYSSFKTMGII
jgi:DNA repair protein RadC